MKDAVSGTFRSLRSFNFRLWTAGALVSNVGTCMQRVAQDWLVLTQLTHHDASALGIVMGLQFCSATTASAMDGIGCGPDLWISKGVSLLMEKTGPHDDPRHVVSDRHL